jgi:small subunit ribosomal protein S17
MAETCKDKHCPKHGSTKVHGRIFTATVMSSRAPKTVIVQFERRYHVPKYERYERRITSLKAHNPDCMNVKAGDIVRITECRPLSKTKQFVVTEKVGAERLFAERAERMAEAKTKQREAEDIRPSAAEVKE